jgi:riboflavin kinase/FMN adenylyltransferase
MLLEQELVQYRPSKRSVCTIGVLDGVHLGHQALIRRTIQEARARDCEAGALVLHPHPREVLVPGANVPLLTPLEERVSLLKALGLDFVLPVSFNLQLSRLSAREFMAALVQHLDLAGIVSGPDFAVGKGREGDVSALSRIGAELGYEMIVIDQLEDGTHKVSSSTIRSAIALGDVETAARLLGRPYVTRGQVVHGFARGRLLGYPTANLSVDGHLALPADGIYATRARAGTEVHASATYIGNQPTFDGSDRSLEVFLLDFDGDLYGSDLSIEWVSKVREDRKFDSPDALVQQMAKDVAHARAALGAASA